MDAEYKALIAELEAREPTTPVEEHEERIEEQKAASDTITLRLEDA